MQRGVIVLRWLAVFAVALGSQAAFAQVPHLIRYQGQAVDSQGVPLEGPYTLTFRLYPAETGGTAAWQEVQPNVPLTKGHFSVLLGQVTALTNIDWSQNYWLSVQVNQQTELAPRQRITSVPLAIRAEVAERLANDPMPSGAIVMWTGAACPGGYTRLSALDNKFLVSGSSYNPTAGGSNSHTHSTPAHAHDYSGRTAADTSSDYRAWNAGPGTSTFNGDASRGWHAHNFSGTTSSGGSGTSGSADSRPEFATVLLCQKD